MTLLTSLYIEVETSSDITCVRKAIIGNVLDDDPNYIVIHISMTCVLYMTLIERFYSFINPRIKTLIIKTIKFNYYL
jgi:hypothetical protein